MVLLYRLRGLWLVDQVITNLSKVGFKLPQPLNEELLNRIKFSLSLLESMLKILKFLSLERFKVLHLSNNLSAFGLLRVHLLLKRFDSLFQSVNGVLVLS